MQAFLKTKGTFLKLTLDALGHDEAQNFMLLESTKKENDESLPRV